MKPTVREMKQGDYQGVRVVDELTQRQYLGSEWDRLSESEKESHLKSRLFEFEVNLKTGYGFVAVINKKIIGFIFAHETLPFRGKLYTKPREPQVLPVGELVLWFSMFAPQGA